MALGLHRTQVLFYSLHAVQSQPQNRRHNLIDIHIKYLLCMEVCSGGNEVTEIGLKFSSRHSNRHTKHCQFQYICILLCVTTHAVINKLVNRFRCGHANVVGRTISSNI